MNKLEIMRQRLIDNSPLSSFTTEYPKTSVEIFKLYEDAYVAGYQDGYGDCIRDARNMKNASTFLGSESDKRAD